MTIPNIADYARRYWNLKPGAPEGQMLVRGPRDGDSLKELAEEAGVSPREMAVAMMDYGASLRAKGVKFYRVLQD